MTFDGYSPIHDPAQVHGAGHYRAADDIEWPSSCNMDSNTQPAQKSLGWSRGMRRSVVIAGLGATLSIGSWFLFRNGPAETQHPNWQHVASAAKASTDDAHQVIHVASSGTTQASSSLEVSRADINPKPCFKYGWLCCAMIWWLRLPRCNRLRVCRVLP